MRLRPSPYIRTRLAAWFILIVAVVLATFSVAVYQLTRYNSLGEVQRDVHQRATLLAAAAAANHGEVPAQALDTEGAPDVFAQIVDASGTVQRSSASLAGRRLPLSAATVGAGQVQEVRLGEVPLYVSGRRLLADGRVRGYVLVARSPRSVYLALSRLRRVLYPGTALALALAGGAGWLLTRRAMRPWSTWTGPPQRSPRPATTPAGWAIAAPTMRSAVSPPPSTECLGPWRMPTGRSKRPTRRNAASSPTSPTSCGRR